MTTQRTELTGVWGQGRQCWSCYWSKCWVSQNSSTVSCCCAAFLCSLFSSQQLKRTWLFKVELGYFENDYLKNNPFLLIRSTAQEYPEPGSADFCGNCRGVTKQLGTQGSRMHRGTDNFWLLLCCLYDYIATVTTDIFLPHYPLPSTTQLAPGTFALVSLP